jgi:cytochrome c peroxidase
MFDGRFKTLDEVLEFYNTGLVYSPYVHSLMHKINEGGAFLTPTQLADLKAFLLTLTDEQFLANPDFANPHTNKK